MTNVGLVELGLSSGEFDVSWVMCGPIGREFCCMKNDIPLMR